MGQFEVRRNGPFGTGPDLAETMPVEGQAQADAPIAEVIRTHAMLRPNAPALVGPGFAGITFAALAAFLETATRRLSGLGLGPQARVGLFVPPGYRGALLVLAVASRSQLVPLNPALTAPEIAEEIRRTGLDALLVPEGISAALPERPTAHVVDVSFTADGEMRVTPRSSDLPRPDFAPALPSSIALLLRSSGTTGEPKQIPVTHRNLLAMAQKMARWFEITDTDRIPCTLPLYYAAGLKTTLFVPLLLGASVGIPAPGRTYEIAEWIDEIEPTILSVAPASLRGLLDRLQGAGTRPAMRQLRFAICGAAYLPDALRREAERDLGVPVLEYYGLSEAGAMAANPAPPRIRKPGTVGLVPAGELVLRGEGGAPVPVGETGEITLRGPSVTPGYVTAQAREPAGLDEGWLATGDLGRIDEDGYLTIVGRLKEIINRGGEKVSPYEVEKALLLHPAIQEVAVFAIPHPRLGETVAAAVVLHPGHVAAPHQIRAALEGKLARFKIPQRIVIAESLPRGVTGKLQRMELTRQFSEQTPVGASRADRMLEHQILAVWSRLLKRDDLGIDDDFFEAGGDSLLAAEMLAEVEELAQQHLPPSRLSANLTIRHLADAVCSDQSADREWMTKVRDGEGAPILFCHGDYSTRGLYAMRLLNMMNIARPAYLLHFYEDLHRADLTIEEIAALYVEEIRGLYPKGPVIVAGYCNGGLVAWELTHRLRSVGIDVLELLLIETPSLNARPAFRALHSAVNLMGRILPGHAGDVIRQEGMRALWHRMRGLGTFRSLFSHALSRAWRRALRRGGKPRPPSLSSMASPHWSYQRTLSRYAPPPLDVRVSCFIAAHGRLMDTDASFWKGLSPQVSVTFLPGAHHSVVTSGADKLAGALARRLSDNG